jgi:hypothetical protein
MRRKVRSSLIGMPNALATLKLRIQGDSGGKGLKYRSAAA